MYGPIVSGRYMLRVVQCLKKVCSLFIYKYKKMEIRQLNAIKSKFVTRTVGDELVIVPLSGNVAQMNRLFTLNETGKFIWEKT